MEIDIDEARDILQENGESFGYVIIFDDPDHIVTSLQGLTEKNIYLAENIEQVGSLTVFEDSEKYNDREAMDILQGNGFELNLAERILGRIYEFYQSEFLNRLVEFIYTVASFIEIGDHRFKISTRTYKDYIVRWLNSYVDKSENLFIKIKPLYFPREIRETLNTLFPFLEYRLYDKSLIIPLYQLSNPENTSLRRKTQRKRF